jgi:hypothetical protein
MISELESALWQAAVKTPKVAGALEVYTDWLLTHAPDRARYLTMRLRGKPGHKMPRTERAAWLKALGVADKQAEIDFDPFPVRVHLNAARLAKAEPLLDRVPFIELLLDFDGPVAIADVFASPVFAKIRALSFRAEQDLMDPDENCQSLLRTYFGSAVLEAMSVSPNVRDLETLSMTGHEIGPLCGKLLAASPFQRLRRLSISGENLGDEGAIALAGSPAFASLVELRLWSCGIGTAGALALARSPHLGNLEELYLSGNDVGPEGAAALRQSTHLTKLRSLVHHG